MRVADVNEVIGKQEAYARTESGRKSAGRKAEHSDTDRSAVGGVALSLSEKAKELLQQRWQEQMEREKKRAEQEGSAYDDMGKYMRIARRIAKGDKVPPGDEKKLMEYNFELYMAAKSQAMMAENHKPKKHKSEFEDEEDGGIEDLARALEKESSGGEASVGESAEISADIGEAVES